jgi:hypothetical protein
LTSSSAQIHDVGVYFGGSNYVGDIGPTDYISPHDPAYGIIYKWNRSSRHSLRFSYTHSTITSDDADSDMPSRVQRGYTFENTLNEISAGLEFNFFEFDLHESGFLFTPYVYTGLNYLNYNGLFFVDGESKYDSTHNTVAIPMLVGIKARVYNHFIIGLEARANYSFTDEIDGSKPTNENLENLQFGNTNSNDWYFFTGFTLSYTFGRKPCYCRD